MKEYLHACSYLIAASLAFTSGSVAHAITISSSGLWTGGTVSDDGTPVGLNTNTLFWGEAVTNQGRSNYQFDGVDSLDLSDNPAGNAFKLGTFTHHNSPIAPSLLTSANLGLTLEIEGQGSHTLEIAFLHDETPNLTPCTHAGTTICPDQVLLPGVGAPQQFAIGNISYEFQLLGFSQALGGPYDNEFITEENQDNTTMIFGQLNPIGPSSGGPPPVPEPATILASGLLLGLGSFAKQRLRSKS